MSRKVPHRLFRLGVALQAVASALVGAGIGIEISMHADVGYVLITLGSLVFGIACKLMRI
mgnify:CR=1 FL=1